MEVDAARVTIVIPAHDEAPVIGDVVRAARASILPRLPGATILVVDDGSGDGTEAAATAAGAQCLRLPRNVGQGPAVRQAFDAARSEWLCQMDGDGQVDPADFWALWERRGESDLLLGVRRVRCDPAHRRALTRMVRVVTGLAGGRPLEDAAAPLRLLRRSTWDDLRPFLDEDSVSLSILVSVAAARRGWRIDEVPVRHRARAHGHSRLRRLGLLAFMGRAVVELATVAIRVREPAPLRAPAPLAER